MDFDKFLTRVQTSLKSIEKSIGVKFVDITRDNGEEIEVVTQLFGAFVKELNPSSENLRHINIYLLINTDFECIQQIENDINFCHLVNTIPKLSSIMYFELMNHTDLYKHIGEVILYCPEVFAVDVLKCISVNLKYSRAEIVNQLLYLIYEGLYKKIFFLNEQQEKENIKQKFVKIFQNLSEFSIFEVIEKSDWKLEKRQCLFGRYVKTLLNLIENCIKVFNSSNSLEGMEVYKMNIEYDYTKWTLQTKEDNWPVYSLQVIICKAKRVLKEINVDIYMGWCEEDYEVGSSINLQTAIREAAYTCREELQTLTKYENKIVDLTFLITGLNSMAVKPRNEDDEIKEANTETIAKNMKDRNKTQLKWLKTYLNINNILLENRCIDDLKNTINIFTKGTTLQLIETFIKHVENNELPNKSIASYKEIILKCVRKLKVDEQVDILNTFASQGTDTLKTTSFNHNVTETFNKLVSQSDRMEKLMPDLIILALESGRDLVSLILAECLKATSLCDLFIQILLEIPLLTNFTTSSSDSMPLCMHRIVNFFNMSFQTDAEDRSCLIYVIKKLSWYSIIDGKDFVVRHLIPVIQKSVPLKKWRDVDICLDILEVFVTGDAGIHVRIYEAEVLAFLAQLLNQSRLQPPKFTVHSGNVMHKTSSFLYTLTASFLQDKNCKTDKEACWLREVGKTLSPMAWFPMRKLWTGMELPTDPNNQLAWSKQNLGRKDLLTMRDQDRGPFVIQLCKVLPLLSVNEWKMIGFEIGGAERAAHCVAVFHILADCLLVLNQLPVVNGNPTCLAHLISGLTTFFKAKVLNALKHSDRDTCLTAINKEVVLVNELSDDVIKMRMAAISSVLQDMAGLVLDKATKDQQQSDLLATVSSVKDTQIQSMLSNRLIKSFSI